MNTDDQALREKLSEESGPLSWPELERHFARGHVIRVDPAADLIEVAFRVSRDDTPAVQHWMETGVVARASTEDARGWHERQANFYAVVAAPWVLVQERPDEAGA